MMWEICTHNSHYQSQQHRQSKQDDGCNMNVSRSSSEKTKAGEDAKELRAQRVPCMRQTVGTVGDEYVEDGFEV